MLEVRDLRFVGVTCDGCKTEVVFDLEQGQKSREIICPSCSQLLLETHTQNPHVFNWVSYIGSLYVEGHKNRIRFHITKSGRSDV